ncbi:hypothetical protein [Leptolyngbya phage Lbo-JY46]
MISNVSQVYKPNPYIPPVDLNLLNSVLMYKESKFENNATQIQQQIDSFSGLDIARDVDKQYLNSKVDKTVNQINGLGGVDLSNPNVMNQLTGMSSSIGRDSNIINAVTSTRGIRSLMEGHNKLKTDPKMKGMYSDVNYNYDMQFVNSYMEDKNVGSVYNGPTSPTPYFDIDKKVIEELKLMKPDLKKDVSNPGYYFLSSSNKSISYDKVVEIARERVLSNPEAYGQAQRNAWFVNKDRDPAQILGEIKQQSVNKLSNWEEQLRYYKTREALFINDPEKLSTVKQQTKELEEAIKNQKLYIKDLETNGPKKIQENPDQYYLDSYLNNFSNGMARIFSFNESTNDIKGNNVAMFNDRINLDGLKAGFRSSIDPITGERVFTFDPELASAVGRSRSTNKGDGSSSAEGGIDPNISDIGVDLNKDREEIFRMTPERMAKESSALRTKKESLVTNYLKDITNYYDEYKDMFSKELVDKLVQFGKSVNAGDTVLGVEDFAIVDDPTASKTLTDGQRAFIKQAWGGWKEKALGNVEGIKNFPAGMDELFTEVQEIDNSISLNNSIIKKGVESLVSVAKLTPAEKQAYEQFLITRPDSWSLSAAEFLYEKDFDFTASALADLSNTTPELRSAMGKIYGHSVKKADRKRFWDDLSEQLTPAAKYVNIGESPTLKNYIFTSWNRTKESPDEEFPGKIDDIKSGRIMKNTDPTAFNGDPWIMEFTVPIEGKQSKPMYAGINAATADSFFGLKPLNARHENIEREIRFNNGVSFDRVLSNKSGFSGTFRVAKRPFVGGFDIQVKHKDENGKIVTKSIPTNFKTPAEAMGAAERLALAYKGTLEQFIVELEQRINKGN